MPIDINAVPVLRQVLLAVVLNTCIALGITAFGDEPLLPNWVYSQCIGLSIWFVIAVAQARLIADWERQWRSMVFIVPLGVLMGYALGSMLADQLLHTNSLGYWRQHPGKSLGLLIMSMGVGVAVSYFLLSRSQLAAERARADAARAQAAESRLRLLQTQLEPHMLFNTLANLRMLIALDAPRAQTMLDHLIAYLRATLNASRASSHSLEEEFARLHDYLALMAVRMGPRLRHTLTLPEALKHVSIPTLLLQPLVENAIRHGLEPCVQGGQLDVVARVEGTQLLLEVTDTGLGLACVPDAAPAPAPSPCSGFGLAQVRERLATVYGERAALILVAGDAGGTRACVTLPLQP